MVDEYIAKDGTTRKSWYGEGEQPFDTICRAGWGPDFAAGNVLKYLRRTKSPEHSIESARWYWARLQDMAKDSPWALLTLSQLNVLLTPEEKTVLDKEEVAS